MVNRVFISGIAGFLGSHLADRMLHNGFEVIGCDNLIGGDMLNVPKGAVFHKADCADLSAMREITAGCQTVFHSACTAYQGFSLFSPSLISQNTYQITSTLLSAAIHNKVSRFIYCSSMARYGCQEEIPFREDMTCRPQDPYGIAKFASELQVKNLCDVHGIEYVIAIPHNIIGPRQKYYDPFRNVASIMINMMLQGRQPVIYGDGTQKRCFSYIKDVLFCLDRLIQADNVVGQTFNIGPDEEFISINDLSSLLAQKLEFDLDPIYVPARPQEVQLATCSADKARQLLGYDTKTTLGDGLDYMIDYIRARGPKKFQYHIDIEIESKLCPETWSDQYF